MRVSVSYTSIVGGIKEFHDIFISLDFFLLNYRNNIFSRQKAQTIQKFVE